MKTVAELFYAVNLIKATHEDEICYEPGHEVQQIADRWWVGDRKYKTDATFSTDMKKMQLDLIHLYLPGMDPADRRRADWTIKQIMGQLCVK